MGHETAVLPPATDGISFLTVSRGPSPLRIMLSSSSAVGLPLGPQPRDSPDCQGLWFRRIRKLCRSATALI